MLQIVYESLFQPHQLCDRFDTLRWWQGGIVLLFSATLLTFSLAGMSHWNGAQLFWGWSSMLLQTLVCWWGFSLIHGFSSEIFGGNGRIRDLMTASGLACAPFILLPPLLAIGNGFGQTGTQLAFLFALALFFWSLSRLSQFTATSAHLSFDRALGSLLMSGFLLLVLLGSTALLAGFQLAFLGASFL